MDINSELYETLKEIQPLLYHFAVNTPVDDPYYNQIEHACDRGQQVLEKIYFAEKPFIETEVSLEENDIATTLKLSQFSNKTISKTSKKTNFEAFLDYTMITIFEELLHSKSKDAALLVRDILSNNWILNKMDLRCFARERGFIPDFNKLEEIINWLYQKEEK